LNYQSGEPIVLQVSPCRFSSVARVIALLALSALCVVLLGATGGLITDPAADGETCVGCAGCAAGECGREGDNPLTSHHHCCTTCCISHAPLSLATVMSTYAPVLAESVRARAVMVLTDRTPETPYRPPRV
jgi:hypothetical protein